MSTPLMVLTRCLIVVYLDVPVWFCWSTLAGTKPPELPRRSNPADLVPPGTAERGVSAFLSQTDRGGERERVSDNSRLCFLRFLLSCRTRSHNERPVFRVSRLAGKSPFPRRDSPRRGTGVEGSTRRQHSRRWDFNSRPSSITLIGGR